MPEQLFSELTSSDLVAFCLGGLLLLLGRKLFWLALGGVGFLAGVWLAGGVLGLQSSWLELGLGLLTGVAGAFLAIFAQKLAVAVAGFVLGGGAALWIASFFESALRGQPEVLLLVIALVGAIVGMLAAPALFEASLAAVTSVVGALLIVSGSQLGPPRDTWLFVALVVIGLVVQSAGGERRRTGRRRTKRRREAHRTAG